MIDNKFERCKEDDPQRCQTVGMHGQCPYKATEHSKYCPRHSGAAGESNHEANQVKSYRLAQWQARVNEFSEHSQVKSLREEIGIARMLLESIILQCQDPQTLLLFSNKISDLVTRIEKLVTSCHRLEVSTSMLLDKSAALHLASTIVEIVTRYVTDAEAIEAISAEIITSIATQQVVK